MPLRVKDDVVLPLLIALVLQPPSELPSPASPPVAARGAAQPEVVDEAVRLLDAEDFEASAFEAAQMQIEVVLAAITEQILKQSAEEVPQDFLDELKQAMREHADRTLRSNLPVLKRKAAELYAQEFTREELIRLRELSADPLLVKARQRAKVLAPKLMVLEVEMARAAQPELEQKIARLVAEHVAKRKGGDGPS